MEPAALGGMDVGEGPRKRREGSGPHQRIRFWEIDERLPTRKLPWIWLQLTWRNAGSRDGNTLEVAEGLSSQLGKYYSCL